MRLCREHRGEEEEVGEVEVEERRGGQGEFCSVLGGRSWVGRWGTRDNSA